MDENWRLQAICREVDPDLWSTASLVARAEARHICVKHCPVLRECHEWTMAHRPSFAVMGGLSFADGGKLRARSHQAKSSRCRLCPPRPSRREQVDVAREIEAYARRREAMTLPPPLTRTLQLVAEGLTNPELAEVLGLSEDGAADRVERLLEVMGAKNRTHAVALAHKRGLLC